MKLLRVDRKKSVTLCQTSAFNVRSPTLTVKEMATERKMVSVMRIYSHIVYTALMC